MNPVTRGVLTNYVEKLKTVETEKEIEMKNHKRWGGCVTKHPFNVKDFNPNAESDSVKDHVVAQNLKSLEQRREHAEIRLRGALKLSPIKHTLQMYFDVTGEIIETLKQGTN